MNFFHLNSWTTEEAALQYSNLHSWQQRVGASDPKTSRVLWFMEIKHRATITILVSSNWPFYAHTDIFPHCPWVLLIRVAAYKKPFNQHSPAKMENNQKNFYNEKK